jgi:uncharacterized protein (TIGR03118 family)
MQHMNLRFRSAWLVIVPAIIWIASASAHASDRTRSRPGPQGFEFSRHAVGRNRYVVVPLVSDGFVPARFVDHNLVNPWGLATGPRGPFWVADNGTGDGTLYDGDGVADPLVVSLPSGAAPTGLVFNIGDNFVVRDGEDFGPSFFIFAGEDGRIYGWNPSVPRGFPSPIAFLAHDDSASGAIYKGLALATTGAGDRLYATDFHNRSITVLDGTFGPVDLPEGAFVDPEIPEDFGPFGIQNIQGRIFVTYARRDAAGEDEVAGPGLGMVSVFDTDGAFLARIATRGPLNAPWGLALAPPGFGRFGGDLLVGNFGGGNIVAYRLSDDLRTANMQGVLSENGGHPIVIRGLWALAFGNDRGAGSSDTLFFTAGPGDEQHGLFGRIEPR